MKICPVCQRAYSDDSLKFCLEDGAALTAVDMTSEPATVLAARQTPFPATPSGGNVPNQLQPPPGARATGSSGAPLVLAIVGGFLLLSAVVGVLGWYLFQPGADGRAGAGTVTNQNSGSVGGKSANADAAETPSVARLESNRKAASPATDANKSGADSNRTEIVASASSVRKADQGNYYFPGFAFDRNPATAWCEGGAGAGVGEWLQFDFGREVTLRQIKIQPGYFKSGETWAKNNRLAAVALQYSNGAASKSFTFADKMVTQTIEVGTVRTNRVRIVIEDYYPGSADAQDTLISDVSFVTEP